MKITFPDEELFQQKKNLLKIKFEEKLINE